LPQIEQLPIFGIHKDIYLAFRYRPSDGQVSSRIYTIFLLATDSGHRLVEYS
jgi:hypothetical protein